MWLGSVARVLVEVLLLCEGARQDGCLRGLVDSSQE